MQRPDSTPTGWTGLFLFTLAFLLLAASAAIWATGGFTTLVAGVRISARTPGVAGVAGVLVLAAWFARAVWLRRVADESAIVLRWIERRSTLLIVLVATCSAGTAVAFGTYTASGSDTSGYLSEAALIRSGHLSLTEPLTATATWPNAPWSLTPLGWRPRDTIGAQVPTYSVGLPLLMSLPYGVAGTIGACLVIAFACAVVVMATGAFATALAGGAAGAAAALLLATSPVFLFQSLHPMSDIPTAAGYIACWAILARSGGTHGHAGGMLVAGAAAAVSVLVRPNLAPMVIVPAAWVWRAHGARAAVLFSVPVAIAGLTIGWVQWTLYGSPLRSGYGSAAELFDVANVGPAAYAYWNWLIEMRAPFLLLAFAGAITGPPLLRWALAFAGLIVAEYLVYQIFDAWTYLRFLMTPIAVACVAVAALAARVGQRLPGALRLAAGAALVIVAGAHGIATARDLDTFRSADRQRRALLAGAYLDAVLPRDAVIVSAEQSGALRHATGRSVLRWDLLDAPSLSEALDQLARERREVWVALDQWEEQGFRQRVAGVAALSLDWPAAVDAGTEMRLRAWRLADRAPFHAGARAFSDRLR